MYVGQLVFAQLKEHLPWQTFRRIVEHYGGDDRLRDFSCASQYRCMTFAQLTCPRRAFSTSWIAAIRNGTWLATSPSDGPVIASRQLLPYPPGGPASRDNG